MFLSELCLLCLVLVLFTRRFSADYSRCYSVDDSSNTLICYSTNGTSNVRSWQAASDYCTAKNSTLVAVGNVTMQNIVVQFRNSSGLGNSSSWIGVHASSAPLALPYIRWIDGRSTTVTNSMLIDPNAYFSTNSRMFVAVDSTNGLVFYHGKGWSVQSSYICQTSEVCTADDMLENDLCYKKYNASATWYEASNQCLTLSDGMLATFNVSQPTDDSQLITWLNGSTGSYWIGLTNTWWIDGNNNDVLYTNWQANHPPSSFSANSPETNCVLMAGNADQNQWIDWDCGDEQPFICQTIQSTITLATTTTASISDTTVVSWTAPPTTYPTGQSSGTFVNVTYELQSTTNTPTITTTTTTTNAPATTMTNTTTAVTTSSQSIAHQTDQSSDVFVNTSLASTPVTSATKSGASTSATTWIATAVTTQALPPTTAAANKESGRSLNLPLVIALLLFVMKNQSNSPG